MRPVPIYIFGSAKSYVVAKNHNGEVGIQLPSPEQIAAHIANSYFTNGLYAQGVVLEIYNARVDESKSLLEQQMPKRPIFVIDINGP